MDQERREVRQVEEARQRVAQDVRSVAHNANVVDRAKENIQGRIEDVRDDLGDRVHDMRDRVADTRDALQDRARDVARNIPLNLADNPVAMLLAGVALGFLIGMVLPVSRFESRQLGPVADDMKDRVRHAGSEAVRRGGEVIKETIQAARETATNSIREQSRDLGFAEED